jgi:hypothetical protein
MAICDYDVVGFDVGSGFCGSKTMGLKADGVTCGMKNVCTYDICKSK